MNQFFQRKGRKKETRKGYLLEWIIIISSWSSYKRVWTWSSTNNSFTKIGQPITDVFTDTKRITKSHIPVANAPIRIDIPIGQSNIANESQTCMKRGRPVGSKDKNPRMRKREKRQDGLIMGVKVSKDYFDIINDLVLEEPQVLEIIENDEISINYVMNHIIWNQNKVNIDEVFAYNVEKDVISENEDKN